MNKYRLTLRFVLEKFDEVEVELDSLDAMNRFLSDNCMLAMCLGFKTEKSSRFNETAVVGALVVECKSEQGNYSYAFNSYKELTFFLSDHLECAQHLGGKEVKK